MICGEQRIPPHVIADIGRAIYGVYWQQALAQAMKVDEQIVRRWTNDGCPVSTGTAFQKLLAERGAEIQRVRLELNDFIPQSV